MTPRSNPTRTTPRAEERHAPADEAESVAVPTSCTNDAAGWTATN